MALTSTPSLAFADLVPECNADWGPALRWVCCTPCPSAGPISSNEVAVCSLSPCPQKENQTLSSVWSPQARAVILSLNKFLALTLYHGDRSGFNASHLQAEHQGHRWARTIADNRMSSKTVWAFSSLSSCILNPNYPSLGLQSSVSGADAHLLQVEEPWRCRERVITKVSCTAVALYSSREKRRIL